MTLKILAIAIAASLPMLSGCASTASSNTTYAQIGNSSPSTVSVPLN